MRNKFKTLCSIMIAAALFAEQPATGQGAADSVGSFTQASETARPGDIVRLRIWREPDMSGEFHVDETGMVVLPRIGPVRVTSEPVDALKARLVQTYSGFLNHSSIEITFLRRVQILGAVRNPGLYPVDPTMTVGDVLALAGGTTTQGVSNTLHLIRRGRRIPIPLTRDLRIADTPLESGDQIFVPERSWISRNPGIVGAIVTATVSLVIAFTR